MSKHPFVVGDIVYHPVDGAGKVTKLSDSSDSYLMVDFGLGSFMMHHKLLSFVAWPVPVRERPIQDGYHLVQFKDYHRVYLGHYRTSRAKAEGKGPWLLVGPGGKPVGDYTYGSDDRNVKPIQFLGATIGDVFKPL